MRDCERVSGKNYWAIYSNPRGKASSVPRVQTGSTIEPSDSAPVANQLLVDPHRLQYARHAAVLVGLVRLLRLARPQHHRGRTGIDLEQVARVGVVGLGLFAGPRP